MSGTVTLLTSEQADVLLLPTSAVHTQGRTSFVYVPGANGTPEQQDVVTGASNGTEIEITSGLNEGDTVLLNVAAPAAAAGGTTTGAPAGGGFGGGFGGGSGGGGGRGGATGGLR
jgi:macrolide-specific efflux system membrane fusion protein